MRIFVAGLTIREFALDLEARDIVFMAGHALIPFVETFQRIVRLIVVELSRGQVRHPKVRVGMTELTVGERDIRELMRIWAADARLLLGAKMTGGALGSQA